MNTDHFEAKKHAYRQTQDGVVISFVVHPNDVNAALATAPLGTRYMIGYAEIGDDGKPIAAKAEAPPAAPPKTRRAFASLPLSQQAALRCNDAGFRAWIGAADADEAARTVRDKCHVASRSELDRDTSAAKRWHYLERDFQAHETTRAYEGSMR